MKFNIHWPAGAGSNYAPWYVIANRLLWCPLVYGGMAIACLGILLSNGPAMARETWDRVF